jgi:hypothetical protein
MLPHFLCVRPGEVVNTLTGEVVPVEHVSHVSQVISERSTGPPAYGAWRRKGEDDHEGRESALVRPATEPCPECWRREFGAG